MGVVWAGRDEVLARAVAVKEVTPPGALSEPQRAHVRERTLREARAAARISSRAAVTVYDVVEEDGRPWIVMELLEPRTLADVLKEEGPLPPESAARIGLRVLDALSAAHGAGVLHRDVKPANVLYDSTGQAVLTDFGIASLEGDPSMTTTGTIIGSPGYVAPERALGRPPSPASDLWSLGVMLVSMVHGRSPFERDSALATLVAALHEPLPDWATEGPLGAAITGLLAKDPRDRIDVATVRTMLQRAASSPAPATAPLPPAAADAQRTQALSLPPAQALGGGPSGLQQRPDEAWTAHPRPPQPVPPPVQAPPSSPPQPQVAPSLPAPVPARRRSRALTAALAVAALLTAGILAALLLGDRQEGSPDTGTSGSSGASEPTDNGSGEAGAEPNGGPKEQAEPTDPAPADPTASEPTDPAGNGDGDGDNSDSGSSDDPVVATGYQVYRDSQYAVAVPQGWSITESTSKRKVYSDPESARYLLVEEGDEPNGDPYEDWTNQEQYVSTRLSNYELIGIERADYRNFDAADWQFRWDTDYGRVRVLNRAVVDDDEAFALYWSVPDDEWDESWPVFQDIAASFEPRS
jgi:serine/threonine protein kinase